ncbi:uncharacterized protein LOC111008113 [Momordica charantia]|uniref:Uncharacterized protein LOC111008113 n=1 Tax=Momordica charantia TaxID=3673 RepID=A0A6J1C7G5_MOMCH|nr:uncharacterized protein LOC111008113 [Momordica charantia]
MAPAKITVAAHILSKKLQFKPQLCKFLGIPLVSPRGDIPILISKFLKLYQPQSPGLRKDRIWEENLKAILCGKDGVGMPEVNKILSPQFNDSSLRNMEMERQKDIRHDRR